MNDSTQLRWFVVDSQIVIEAPDDAMEIFGKCRNF